MSPSSEQKILISGVSKGNLSKIYLLSWIITEEIKLRMFWFKIIHNTVFTKDRLFKASIVQAPVVQRADSFIPDWIGRYPADETWARFSQ